jgi:hypothetical protein
MKKIVYILFVLLFVSNLQAHKPHDDAFLQELQGVISKKAFESVKSHIKDFSLESHYVYKNTALDSKLQELLKADIFDKKEYLKVLKEIYKDNKYVKDISMEKSTEILATLHKKDRAYFAYILKTINQHKH